MILETPFLTDIDPNAAIKGSRDPLGIQPLWARMGRHVVGNLTYASSSVRAFSTMILGYYFAERVLHEVGGDGDLAVFLRWEQLASYARGIINRDWDFRGVERAKMNLEDGARVRLGTDPGAQILSNQKTYGIWGLYTVPGKSSGLVEGDPTRVTPAGRELVESVYLPIFNRYGFRNGDAIVARLARPKSELDVEGADRNLLKAAAKVLDGTILPQERMVLNKHLVEGGPQDRTMGKQALLASVLRETLSEEDWVLSPARISHIAKRSKAKGEVGQAVAERLERIRSAESLLAPATALFGKLASCDGQKPAEVASALARYWKSGLRTIDVEGISALESELRDATGEPESGGRWVRLSRALAAGDYKEALNLLMEQNRQVMKLRGGAAWVDVEKGRLRVRFKDDSPGRLPDRRELGEFWKHSYFVDALRTIAGQLES